LTAEDVADPATADVAVQDSGYEPVLKRTLGGFQLFAISFAFISVAVGVFATYGIVLNKAGPVGIWLWVVAAVGQTLVALVVAQFAARIALSGSSYQWGLAAGQPEDRLVVRVADVLVSGDGRGRNGQRIGQPSVHAVIRNTGKRGHGAADDGGDLDRAGRTGDCLDAAARLDHLRCSGD
jgi:hypothetical protein